MRAASKASLASRKKPNMARLELTRYLDAALTSTNQALMYEQKGENKDERSTSRSGPLGSSPCNKCARHHPTTCLLKTPEQITIRALKREHPQMTVKELKELLDKFPDDVLLEIFNSSYEWYGIEPIESSRWRLILHFGGNEAWDWHDEDDDGTSYEELRYQEERQKLK